MTRLSPLTDRHTSMGSAVQSSALFDIFSSAGRKRGGGWSMKVCQSSYLVRITEINLDLLLVAGACKMGLSTHFKDRSPCQVHGRLEKKKKSAVRCCGPRHQRLKSCCCSDLGSGGAHVHVPRDARRHGRLPLAPLFHSIRSKVVRSVSTTNPVVKSSSQGLMTLIVYV